MILSEPSPSQGDLHFDLLGFPVRIHPFFWLAAVFLGFSLRDPILVGLWVVAVLLCILLHELGHALVMRAYGYGASIVLYTFGGLAIPHPGRYGARRPGPWGDMLIAFAGPASGFVLAAVLTLGLHYLGGYPVRIFRPSWHDVVPIVGIPNENLFYFVHFILWISVMWGLINLLPIYPLDGGLISQQVFTLTSPRDAVRRSLLLSVIAGASVTAVLLVQALNQPDVQLLDFYPAAFFGYLTYSNYTSLQSSQGGWR